VRTAPGRLGVRQSIVGRAEGRVCGAPFGVVAQRKWIGQVTESRRVFQRDAAGGNGTWARGVGGVALGTRLEVRVPVTIVPSPSALRIAPLGGLGEIGLNCLLLEHHDSILLVDCGTSFPVDDHGVDVIRPDFRYLADKRDKISGVFLTHGHEDHIGAIPFLLDEFRVPIWGPPHALALVKKRLAEHDFDVDRVDLRTSVVGGRHQVGAFEVEPIRVAHSIVDATALAIRSPGSLVVHTGDFDFDPEPPDGRATDADRLAALGDEGVDLLLSDSTNVEIPTRMGSEKLVAESLLSFMSAAPERVFLALFASNIQRLMSIGALAQKLDRKICLLGRSLLTQVRLCHELGHLHWPSDLVIAADQLRDCPRSRALVLAGGTQAERASSVYRLAKRQHRWVDVESGDLVIFSSRTIPGNERPVHEVVCDLLRLGARVVTRTTDPSLHTSGHASREELSRMLKLVRPRSFVPVHGTLHHLLRHAELAREMGLGDVQVIENGTRVRLEDKLVQDGTFPTGVVPIELGGQPLDREELGERTELGRHGIVLVSLVVDPSFMLVVPPRVSMRGVPLRSGENLTVRTVEMEAARAAAHARRRGHAVEEEVRRAVRHVVFENTGCRPTVEIHSCEMPS
jgi:ribonuclease J